MDAGELLVIGVPVTLGRPSFAQRMDRVRQDLDRLRDGWCGEGSIAPLPKALVDLDRLLVAIPNEVDLPEVEADEETGFITLRWAPLGRGAGFSFVLRGDGRALAVKTVFGADTSVTSRPFELRAHADAIARFLASDAEIVSAIVPA